MFEWVRRSTLVESTWIQLVRCSIEVVRCQRMEHTHFNDVTEIAIADDSLFDLRIDFEGE